MKSFQVHALDPQQFKHYFSMSDDELKQHNAHRELVSSKPGIPCRVSLQDAEVDEEVLLLNFEHQAGASPFKASHAIYVREGVAQAEPEIDHIPDSIRDRLISLRAFDAQHLMLDADVVEGTNLVPSIQRLFKAPNISYLHLHYARPGCYAAMVTPV